MKKKRLLCGLLAMASAVSMAGCGNEKKEGPTKITWYVPAVLDGDAVSEVMNTVNEKLMEKYQLQLDVIGIDGGNYDKKMQLINAGQEEYDLAFTATWKNDYYSNVSNGSCLDITELLPKYAPKLYAETSPDAWEAVKVDGKIYAAPNWQIQAKATDLIIPDENLKATGMTMDQINSLDDVEIYLSKLHEINPECNKVRPSWNHFERHYGFLDVISEGMVSSINFKNEGDIKVFNQFETKEYEEYVKKQYEWAQKGYIFDKFLPEDIKTSTMEKKEVRQRPFIFHVYTVDKSAQMSQNTGYEWQDKLFSDAILDGAGVMSALTHVSATTKHPEEAVKMLEIMNTDKEIYNLLVWGIEGKNYKLTDGERAERIENSGYAGIAHWILGSQKNSYLLPGSPENIYEDTKKFNDSAIVSPILGFSVNLDNISVEIANCKTVLAEKETMLELGLVEPEKGLAELKAALNEAGADVIVAEVQKQIDEWCEKK